MIKRWTALLCALMLALPLCGLADPVVEDVSLDAASLPIDLTPGRVPDESRFTENGYEDDSITVTMERVTTETAIYNVAHVKIADPSQLRTAVTARGRTNKISALARKNNAVVAVGGEYFATDDTGYIVRMGEVQLNSKKKAYKKPIETRDLLLIDQYGDFHILLRKRNGKPNKKTINEDFADDLKALVETYTPVNVFDFGPALIIDGEKTEQPAQYSFNIDGKEPRCAIGQVGPLEYVLVVVDTATHHARGNGEGADFQELQDFMAQLGCTQAYNLDGGNSALMVFHGKNYSDKTEEEERSVSDIIYFATAVDFGLGGE